jgi:hypothetical protein
MKSELSTGINIRFQERAHHHAARLLACLGLMVIALTCGHTTVAQQTNQPATEYQHRQNVSACESGWGRCDEGLLTPDETAQLAAIRHRQNVSACESGWGRCNESLLTPVEAAQLAVVRHRQNVSACESGWGRCDEGRLTPDETAQLAVVRRRQNVSACETGWGRCDESLLTPDETAQLTAARHRLNVSSCESGWGRCDAGLLTSSEAAQLVEVRRQQNARNLPATAPVAENGSYYGELNANGVPKTVSVQGYTRSDGTYVRGYYRSAPGTNPAR